MYLRHSVVLLLCGLVSGVQAGGTFYHAHRERTRCSVPRYDYQVKSPPIAASVISEAAVPVTGGPSNGQIVEVGRAFVFDDIKAGPLQLTNLAAKSDSAGNVLVTGVVTHTGGDAQQLQGGKAVIRIEPLTSAGANSRNPAVLAAREASCWVRRGEPETVQICVNKGTFGDVQRVRVFLEYRPVR